MHELDVEKAVGEIHQACESAPGQHSPFFLIVGAGVSAPMLPLASEIETECRQIAAKYGRVEEPQEKDAIVRYSHFFSEAFPHAQQRQRYSRDKMKGRPISPATFRLAHLLLKGTIGNLVVTPNFDDFLSRALSLFGAQPIICDHPNTISRISRDSSDIQIVHVHGTYWYYDCCNLKDEIEKRESVKAGPLTIPSLLDSLLWNRSPIVVGYSGWEGDVIMSALKRRLMIGMPFDVYWFCYRRADYELLPDWLKAHSNMRFVLPKPDPSLDHSQESDTPRMNVDEPLALQAAKPSSQALPAQRIFDLLIESFGLDTPEITKNPIRFFADHLQRSIQETGDSTERDIYGFKSVVSRMFRAAETAENETRAASAIDIGLEQIRDAVRRSAYKEALQYAKKIPLAAATNEQLEDLIKLTISAAVDLGDDSEDELAGYRLICNVANDLEKHHSLNHISLIAWVRSLKNMGIVLHALGQNDKALEALDQALDKLGNANDAASQEQFAKALGTKADVMRHLGHFESAIEAYNKVIYRFGGTKDRILLEQLMRALANKGLCLDQLGRLEEAITAYEEVHRRFSNADEDILKEGSIWALVHKGLALGESGRGSEAFVIYDEIVSRFGESTNVRVRVQVAFALTSKASLLAHLNRNEEAIIVCNDILRRFHEAAEPALRDQVSWALLNKGHRLGALGRSEEALSSYEEVVHRFSDSTSPGERGRVVSALLNKGIQLSALNRYEDALVPFNEALARFGDSSDLVTRERLAWVLLDKGAALTKLNRNDQAMAVYDEILQRLGDATDLSLQRLIARALLRKASIFQISSDANSLRAVLGESEKLFKNQDDHEIQGYLTEIRALIDPVSENAADI